MSVKSIKRVLKDAIVTHFESQMGSLLEGTQVVASFAGATLSRRHVSVTASASEQQIQGSTNLGRWNVTAAITAVSQIDDFDVDQHDNLIGTIEAYVLQGNETLAALLTTAEIKVDNVMVGQGVEVAVEDMLYSGQELICECYMLGA